MDDDQRESAFLALERKLDELSNKKDQLAANVTPADIKAAQELAEIETELNAIRYTLLAQQTDDEENPGDDLEFLEQDIAGLEERLKVLLQAIQPDSTVTI